MRRLVLLFLSLSSFGHFIVRGNEEVKFISFADVNSTNNLNAIVLKNGVQVCAGARIAKTSSYDVVITAAHCVYPVSNNRISVQVNGSTPVEAKHVIVYPHYAPPSLDYDIAIIKFISTKPQTITTSIPSTTTTSIPSTTTPETPSLSETEPKKGTSVNIYIKGSNSNQWNLIPEIATVEDRQICKSKYQGIQVVSYRMICAFSQNPSVDGSPLMFENKFAGITSKPSRNGTLPTIYTSLANSYIRSFIYSYLK